MNGPATPVHAAGAPLSPAQARLRLWLEPALAFILAYIGYRLLAGELPHHDVAAIALRLSANRFLFDIAHVLLDPVTLLWHRHLSFGGPLEESQRSVSIFASSLAIGVLNLTLLVLRQSAWRRICICLAVGLSYNIIILAPSGHMKLAGFPFLNAGILCMIAWEMHIRARSRLAPGTPGGEWWLVGGGVGVAMATTMHASALAAAPFVTLAALLLARRAGASWLGALRPAVIFAGTTGGLFVLIVILGFYAFSDKDPTIANAFAAIAFKASLPPDGISPLDSIGRLVFGTAGNLVAAPDVGPKIRALMHGWDTSITPYLRVLLIQGIPLALSGLLVAGAYIFGVLGTLQNRRVVMALAFLIGAQAWPAYYDLNDSEHYFALTVPTLLLVILAFPARSVRIVLPVATFLIVATNLAYVGIPTATYPLKRYSEELTRQLTPRDLIVNFAAYPGGAYAGFLETPGIPRLRPDLVLQELRTPEATLAVMASQIDATLAAGGRVLVFDMLDPVEWNAPWSLLYRRGLTKPMLKAFINGRYTVGPEQSIAELKVWQLTRKP